jgi:ribosomal-protein-alanine acetyltransferase
MIDALQLDANYVRRTDAEVKWKDTGRKDVKRAAPEGPMGDMIREMAPADAAAIESVLAASAGASQWSAADLLHLAKTGTRIWIAEQAGELVGASATRTVADEVEVLTLGVAPSWRRRGVGRRLMDAALSNAGQEGARQVFLEVRESNGGARAFYAALGFIESGRRRAYYRDPAEDALVLARPVPTP